MQARHPRLQRGDEFGELLRGGYRGRGGSLLGDDLIRRVRGGGGGVRLASSRDVQRLRRVRRLRLSLDPRFIRRGRQELSLGRAGLRARQRSLRAFRRGDRVRPRGVRGGLSLIPGLHGGSREFVRLVRSLHGGVSGGDHRRERTLKLLSLSRGLDVRVAEGIGAVLKLRRRVDPASQVVALFARLGETLRERLGGGFRRRRQLLGGGGEHRVRIQPSLGRLIQVQSIRVVVVVVVEKFLEGFVVFRGESRACVRRRVAQKRPGSAKRGRHRPVHPRARVTQPGLEIAYLIFLVRDHSLPRVLRREPGFEHLHLRREVRQLVTRGGDRVSMRLFERIQLGRIAGGRLLRGGEFLLHSRGRSLRGGDVAGHGPRGVLRGGRLPREQVAEPGEFALVLVETTRRVAHFPS